jgi:peptidoglycan hydrolase CwlO-like protein
MTITAEDIDETTEVEENGADEVEQGEGTKRGRKRDFTKSNEHYDELAQFINSHQDWVNAGLGEITPLQVKAVLALKTDHANTPEVIAAREARKAEREAEKAKYGNMTDEQIKAAKAAARAQAQYDKLQAKAQEALEKAQSLAAAASGSAEDLQAVVEGDESTEDEPKKRRGLRR